MKTRTLALLLASLITFSILAGAAGYYVTLPGTQPTPTATYTPKPTVQPTATPTPTLLPLPYHPYDIYPEPNSTDVPVTVNISITFSRPPPIVELHSDPEIEISHVTKETVDIASGRFTFHLAKPLQPETVYTVTITYGQEKAPEGFKPTSTITWSFKTASIPTPTPYPTSTPTESPKPSPTASPSSTPTPVPTQNYSYSIYFTPDSQVANYLSEAISNARSYVYAAFYDLDLTDVAEDLLEAKMRGVDVRVVTDSDNMDNPAITLLQEAGVVIGDSDPDFMHNKFVIIDDELVWTGSMNPTFNGVNRNNNNVVVITGVPELVAEFKQEFEELWSGVFGGGEPTLHPEITVNSNFSLEVYFAPEDEVESQIIEELTKAEKAIYFATFTFTSRNIADVLINEHNQGVSVNGIYESFQTGGYSTYNLLLENGIEVIKDGNPAVMHHKFFVIDNYTVVTGSFNPTKHANEDNDENILIIHNRAVAEIFAIEFKKLWKEWHTPTPTPEPTSPPNSKIVISYVHYDAAGNDHYNLNDEYVILKNNGVESVDLTGWILKDEAGHTFKFPSFILEAGATVTIHTGSGEDTQTDLYWGSGRAIWNNDHDTVYLYDDGMKLIDSESW